MDADIDAIQPGWTVCASDGHELGTVAAVEGENLIIKHKGLLGEKRLTVPRLVVAEVETGRVELSITKHEAEKRQ